MRPQVAAAVLAATVAVLLAAGVVAAVHPGGPVLWIFRRAVLGVFRLSYAEARGLTLPGVAGGLLLLAAAALVWAVAARAPGLRRSLLLGLAVALGILGLDEALAVHDVLLERTSGGARAWAPAAALGAAALAAGAAAMRSPPARVLLTAGGGLWIAAQSLEIALGTDAGEAVALAREAAELVACAVVLLAALAQARVVAAATPRLGGRRFGDELFGALHPARVAVGLAGGVLLLAVLGAATHAGRLPFDIRAFRMEGERTVPAFFSAGLLLVASVLAVSLAGAAALAGDRMLRRAAAVLAVGFAALGADELVAAHEPYEPVLRTAGSAAQIALLASLAAIGIAWLVVLARLRAHAGAAAAWLAGPVLWLAASVVDQRGLPLAKLYESVVEDSLEMTGSSLFVLALLAGVRARLPLGEAPGVLGRVLDD